MMFNLYAVYDKKSQVYGQPFMSENDDSALRSFYSDFFNQERHNPSSPFVMFLEDFDLHRVGSFDVSSGNLTSEKFPQEVTTGVRARKVVSQSACQE